MLLHCFPGSNEAMKCGGYIPVIHCFVLNPASVFLILNNKILIMTYKIFLSVAGILFPLGLLAQEENQATVLQQGTNQEVLLVQESKGNEISVEQIGSNSIARARQFGPENSAEIYQEGHGHLGILNQNYAAEGSFAKLVQTGSSHQAYMLQASASSYVQHNQNGNSNFVELSQSGYQNRIHNTQSGDNGILYQTQSGNRSTALVVQYEGSMGAMTVQYQSGGGLSDNFSFGSSLSSGHGPGLFNYAEQRQHGDNSFGSVEQTGNFNESFQRQDGNYGLIGGYHLFSSVSQDGVGNYSLTDQYGSNHSTHVHQIGTDNEARIYQSGLSYHRFTASTTWLVQEGRENMANIEQLGGGHAKISQIGNNNEVSLTHLNSGSKNYKDYYNLILDQEGNYNEADLMQSGLSNLIELNQTGNRNMAELAQSGSNNLIEASQHTNGAGLFVIQTGTDNSAVVVQQ